MKPDLTETTLTERKVVRRGLIAGLAGLGAAAIMEVLGAGRAEATDGNNVVIGNVAQTGQSETRLTASPVFLGPGLQVINGGGAQTSSSAIVGSGGGGRYGVLGVSDFAAGVYGTSNTNAGVYGISSSAAGVVGQSNSSVGVYGATVSTTLPAVQGTNSSDTGPGVNGISNGGKGVFGQSSSGDGVHGSSANGVGVRGTSPTFVGVVGISDYSIGLYGYNVAPNVPALYAENLAANPANRFAAQFRGDVWVHGNFVVAGGSKSAAVTMPDGSEAVLYCQESPEPYFEDFGRARLVNGGAHVQLELEFASIVKRDDYMVFITPGGESKSPLYVGAQSANGFDVREANGGTSNIAFSYRIVAKRKDIEGKRLARLDPQVKANIGRMRAAAAAKNHPSVKVPAGGNPLVPLEPIPTMPEPPARRPER